MVFGAGSPLGASVVRCLADAGEKVRAVVKNPDAAAGYLPASVEIAKGNPLDPDDVARACAGTDTIYHCVVFRSQKWRSTAHVIMGNLLGYAIQNRTGFVFADMVYDSQPYVNNFGDDVLSAHREGYIRGAVARLPELYGPGARSTLYDEIFDAILSDKKAYWVARLDAPRDLLFLEDAARAISSIGRSPKAYGRSWEISSGTPTTGQQFIELAFKLAGKPPRYGTWRKSFLKVAGILDYDSKELGEVPYDYSREMILNGADFSLYFPRFEYTPFQQGLAATFDWYKGFLKPRSLRERLLPVTSLPP